MPVVHYLNVKDGDCSIIQHALGNVSVIDICNARKEIDWALWFAGAGLFANPSNSSSHTTAIQKASAIPFANSSNPSSIHSAKA